VLNIIIFKIKRIPHIGHIFSTEKFIFKILWGLVMINYIIKYEHQIYLNSNILSKIYYKLIYNPYKF
jgi:hypothetical protein